MGVIAEEAVRVRADTKGFHSEVSSGVMSAVKKVAAAAGGIFAAEKIGDFAKDAIKGAAALEVQQRRIRTVFGESGESVQKFGEQAATKLGLSALAADRMSASMGQVLESMGIGKKRAAGMSEGLVKMSADLASFTGSNPADVFNALQKGTLGATRGLKQYGINISQADVANQALASGIIKPIKNTLQLQNAQLRMKTTTENLTLAIQKHGKGSKEAATATLAHNNAEVQLQKAMQGTVPHLTTAQKSLASYQLIMKAGSVASGDFKKHSHDLGNEQKILGAEFSNISDSIGKVFLPIVVAAGGALIKYIPEGINAIKSVLNGLAPQFDAVKDAISGAVDIAKQFSSWVSDNVGNIKQIGIAIGIGAAAFVTLTGAVKIYTGVQAALNAVMDANPIGLIILAIAALVVGLTLLYQRSQTARNIMNAAFGDIKTAASAVFGFITNTIIPDAIAAWNRFGPGVVSALTTAANTIKTVVQGIATVVKTVIDAIKAHWDQIWSVFGPLVKGYLEIAKTSVKAVLDLIMDVVRLFSDLLHGKWGAAWGELKNLASDALNLVKTVVSTALTALATSAGNLAVLIGKAIAAGVKKAAEFLVGLAGDVGGKIKAALSQVAKDAAGWAEGIGKAIYNGVLSPLKSLKSAVENLIPFGGGGGGSGKVKASGGNFKAGASGGSSNHGAQSTDAGLQTDSFMQHIAIGLAGIAPKIKAQMDATLLDVFAHSTLSVRAGVEKMTTMLGTIGTKLGEKLAGMRGDLNTRLDPLIEEISNASPKAAAKLITKAKAVEKPIQDAFVSWIEHGKAAFDARAAGLIATVDAVFAKAQAKIDKWKASMTPTEALIAQKEAERTAAAVLQTVAASKAALAQLDADFAKSWAKLLSDQAANMAKLKAQQGKTVTDKDIAGHEFDKQATKTKDDPLAKELLAADKNLIDIKAKYAAGTASLDELNAAVDRYDAATLAAQDDTDAQTLQSDYDTWQGLVQQAADGAAGILAQEDADAQARVDAQKAHDDARVTAQQAVDDALQAQQDAADVLKAAKERAARDAEAAALNDVLVKRHDRILAHLREVIKAHDQHFAELERMAKKSGGTIGENLAKAMRDSIPLVDSAASALAETVKKYLKTGSPTEAGPMSDLDHWWDTLAPTLVKSLDDSGIKKALSDAVTPSVGEITGARRIGLTASDPGVRSAQRVERLLERIEKHTGVVAEKPNPVLGSTPVTVIATGGADAAVIAARR